MYLPFGAGVRRDDFLSARPLPFTMGEAIHSAGARIDCWTTNGAGAATAAEALAAAPW